ncbi:hypothetical protein HJ588_01075 [Flexivirga sp. ID2601S]|uniref:Erythromycin biosynthesis protein CIII-like C-terminal domain-containing protein n=1 Tax=Flexivirga aerilata TaxID=1656889 RepID=A0A849AD85_9MICO|nr:nucleotide disphospho-sugar-binding domain-containing protein [Flexivirga aerilata]NNG37867.1 hypothetical protein [Flexivirga aerilata]
MDWLSWVDEIVQLTVPGFEYPRESTVPVRFAGPLSRSGDSDHPLPDWWAGLDPNRPTVLVTQGSAVPDPHNLILPVVEAAEGMALNLVVSAPDVMELGRLPSYARRSPFLPYDAVFPRLSAFVTNGGYGGVGFAIRHGVPVLSVGASEDKGEVAARVRWSGLGIGIRRNRIPPARAGRELGRLLMQPAYRQAAARLQRQAAEAPGLDSIVAAVSGRP